MVNAITSTPAQLDDIERETRALLDEGYQNLPYIVLGRGRLVEPGTRVYHYSQQFHAAYWFGTATVLACYEKNPSSWTAGIGRGAPDLEFLVQYDTGDVEPGRIVRWADYHLKIAKQQVVA